MSWQENRLTELNDGLRLVDALDQLENLIESYNAAVKAAENKVTTKLFFTIATIGGTMIPALLNNPMVSQPTAFAAATSCIALARFLSVDSQPVVNAGEAQVAAMFHEVEETFA